MADKLIKAMVTIPLDSAIPADYITNTFYFDGDDTLGEDTDAEYYSVVENLLTDFYQAIDQDVFPESIASPAVVKCYDMRDALPRAPEFTFNIALTPSVNRALPHEVAVCLSFAGAIVSGIPTARLRGRVFIGPLAQSILTTDPGPPMVSADVRDLLTGAAGALTGGGDTAVGSHVSWAIYSPTLDAVGSVDDAFNDVTHGWCDNAFDTQRRRGQSPTARSTFG